MNPADMKHQVNLLLGVAAGWLHGDVNVKSSRGQLSFWELPGLGDRNKCRVSVIKGKPKDVKGLN